MSKAEKKAAVIVTKEILGEGIISMWIEQPEIVKNAKPGQFVTVYCKDGSRLLPRPISICELDHSKGRLRLVFRVAGEGTKEIAGFEENTFVDIIGPLGNGYTLEGKKAILIGGGIGIPPMLELAKTLSCEKTIVLGYRDADTFLVNDFAPYGTVLLSTEDGSLGTKGNVIDAIKANQVSGDMIFACGPTPMLKGVKQYAKENNITAQLSLEERMACGIGACLGCVVKSKDVDGHSYVHNKRVCKDGPVFYAEEVEL